MVDKPIRIAAFGHRGVGKSTYLTALYMMLVNNTYRGVNLDYTDDDTAAKLSEYLNAVTEGYVQTTNWQLPATVSLPQELRFTLRRKGQEYPLVLLDYRGEATTIGEMTQNKELLDFFATCDGLMIFNANESDEADFAMRRANHLARHQDLKYLLDQLKKRSGQARLQIPVAMVYTKSDKINFGTETLEDWLENRNSALLETLRQTVGNFQTVFVSSQMAFDNVLRDDRFKMEEVVRSGSVVKSDADVAQPLFWLLDRIRPAAQVLDLPAEKTDTSGLDRWLALAAGVVLVLVGVWFFTRSGAPDSNAVPTNFQSNVGTSQSQNGLNGNWTFASTRKLTAADLARFDKQTLRLIRNEIFARHGYLFKSDDLRQYFGQQSWYVGRHLDCSQMLSEIEKYNIQLIKSYE